MSSMDEWPSSGGAFWRHIWKESGIEAAERFVERHFVAVENAVRIGAAFVIIEWMGRFIVLDHEGKAHRRKSGEVTQFHSRVCANIYVNALNEKEKE